MPDVEAEVLSKFFDWILAKRQHTDTISGIQIERQHTDTISGIQIDRKSNIFLDLPSKSL